MSYKYDKTYRLAVGHNSWLRKMNMQKRLDSICKEVKTWKNKRVLDVGCSGGMLQNLLSDHCSEVYGLDINDFILTTTDFQEQYICGDAMRMPLRSNCFDVVICSHLLEHIPFIYQCLKEMRRVSKHGAKIFLLYPIEMFRGVTCIPDVILHGQRLSLIQKIHLHRLNLKKLQRYFLKTRLRVITHRLIFALQPMYMTVITK